MRQRTKVIVNSLVDGIKYTQVRTEPVGDACHNLSESLQMGAVVLWNTDRATCVLIPSSSIRDIEITEE